VCVCVCVCGCERARVCACVRARMRQSLFVFLCFLALFPNVSLQVRLATVRHLARFALLSPHMSATRMFGACHTLHTRVQHMSHYTHACVAHVMCHALSCRLRVCCTSWCCRFPWENHRVRIIVFECRVSVDSASARWVTRVQAYLH